jgi:hypothetical protein
MQMTSSSPVDVDRCCAGTRSRAARRLLTAAAATMLLTLASAGPALADSASLSFTDAAGVSDPVVGVGRTITLSVSSAVSTRVHVRFRPAGGAPCAPSASSDSGASSFEGFSGDTFSGTTVNGNVTLTKTGIWPTPGTFQFCIWLAESTSTPATAFVQHVTFRRPVGSISATVAPITPRVGETATVTIVGSTEAPKYIYASIRAAGGAPCATSASADSGHRLVNGVSKNGAFSVPVTTIQSAPGTYLICLWLADSSSDGTPVAGPQPATFTVIAPCVVPAAPRFTALAPFLTMLSAANCTSGAMNYTASRTFPRGTIIKTTPVAGTSLAPQAPVTLLISAGKRCRVPQIRAGARLTGARMRLRALNCVPGRVRTVRSSRRRGNVVGYTPGSGRTLKPRAVVGIRISGGPRYNGS